MQACVCVRASTRGHYWSAKRGGEEEEDMLKKSTTDADCARHLCTARMRRQTYSTFPNREEEINKQVQPTYQMHDKKALAFFLKKTGSQ